MAVNLVQQTSARKVFNGGAKLHTYAGATTAGNLLVAVVAMEPDGLGPPTFTTPAGWTFDGVVQGYPGSPTGQTRFFLYRKTADGTETTVTFAGWTAGTPGIIYIAEFINVAEGDAQLVQGTFVGGGGWDGESAPHTAFAGEIALHIFFDASLSTSFTWNTGALGGDSFSDFAQHDLVYDGVTPGGQTVLSVVPGTYLTGGAKSANSFRAASYGSFLGIATLAFGAIPVPITDDAAITVDLRLVKVKETSPPYQVPA